MRLAVLATCAMASGCLHSEGNGPQANPDLSPVAQVQQPVGIAVPGPNYQPFREGIDLSVSEVALQHNITSDHFDFSQLRELWVRVKLNDVRNTTIIHMTLLTPSGSPFYETTVPYSPDPTVKTIHVPRAPHEIDVYHAPQMGTGNALIYVIPVAGSAMARYPVPGTWRLVVDVEGRPSMSVELQISYT
jgi:hypothetical protein